MKGDHVTLGLLLFLVVVAVLLLGGAVGGAFSDERWEDLRAPASNIRLAGANPATSVSYKSSEVLSFASNVNQYAYVIFQIPHGWDLGSNITAHIHWTIPVNSTRETRNIKWDLTYSWADVGEVFPIASSDTVTVSVEGEALDTHFMSSWGPLDGSSHTYSSILLLSIKRDTTVAQNYTSSAYLLEVDLHYQTNQMGTELIPSDYP